MSRYSHILKQKIDVQHVVSTNDYSEPTYDTATEVKARVELVNKSKWSPTGEMIPIAAKILVEPETVVDAGDKVTYLGVNYKVMGKISNPDASGKVSLVELECTEWR